VRTRNGAWSGLRRASQHTASLLAAAFFLLVCANSLSEVHSSAGVDYYQFWTSSRFAADSENAGLYSGDAARAAGFRGLEQARRLAKTSRMRRAAEWNHEINPNLLDPISTPAFYMAIGLATTGDYDRDYWLIQSFSSLAFAVALLGLCRLLRFAWPSALLTAAAVMLLFAPFHADVEAANVNRLQFAALGLAAWLLHEATPRRVFLAGFVLAATSLFKPNLVVVPAALAILWVLDRRKTDLRFGALGLFVGGTLTVVSSMLFLGSLTVWLDWLEIARRVLATPYPIEHLNVSLATLLRSLWGVDLSRPLGLALLASFVACAWVGSRGVGASDEPSRARFQRDLLAISAGCVLPLIAAQIAWDHYFLLAALPIVVGLRPDPDLDPTRTSVDRRKGLALLAFLLIAQSPVTLFIPFRNAQQVAALLALGAATLWGLILWELTRRRPAPSSARARE